MIRDVYNRCSSFPGDDIWESIFSDSAQNMIFDGQRVMASDNGDVFVLTMPVKSDALTASARREVAPKN